VQPTTHHDSSTQHYASAARKAAEAVKYYNNCKSELQCILTLGDIIDGQPSAEESLHDLETVAAVFDQAVWATRCL
jgi:hypothetical protein